MKFYSEKTEKLYDSEEELKQAESQLEEAQKKEEEKKQARAARAKEVEDAFKAASEAQKKANDLLVAFTKDYGSFHMTYKDESPFGFRSFFDFF